MKAEAYRPFDCFLVVVNVPRERAVELYAGLHISPISGKQPKIALTAMDRQTFVYRALRRASADHTVWPSSDRETHSYNELQTAAQTTIETTKRHILDNPRQDLNLRALAEVAGVSPRHLSRLFRAETRMSPAAYVERTRINVARQLLEGTTDPIKTVAHAAGFGSTTTLRRAFLRKVGVTPATYRLQFRAEWPVAREEDGSAAVMS
jgi:transcriptional regulator GlxA family with amidase domain